MNIISLKDYAKQKNISYEAVRQQVVRYKKELDGHLIKDGRQQFLDEEAVAFLDAKRQKNPVAIIQMDKDEQIENLERENKNLLIKVAEQAEELRAADKALAEVNVLLLTAAKDKERAEALEAQNGEIRAEKEKLVLEVQKTRETSEKLSEELTAIQNKWWYKLFGGKKHAHVDEEAEV